MSRSIRIACLLAAAVVLAGCQKDFTAVALTSTGKLIQFTTKKPSSLSSTVNVSLSTSVSNDSVIAMAAQPGSNTLFCVTAKGYLCQLNASTGAATLVSQTPFTQNVQGSGGNSVTLSNPVISFDPIGGDLRVITSDYNLLVNPGTGALDLQVSKIGFDSSDTNNGKSPVLAGIAYQNPVSGASSTTVYALDITTASLLRIGNKDVGRGDSSVNSGDLHTIGTLNSSLSSNSGFAIAPSDGTAYASLQNGSAPTLYTVDLGGGSATSLGTIGDGTLTINSLVINP